MERFGEVLGFGIIAYFAFGLLLLCPFWALFYGARRGRFFPEATAFVFGLVNPIVYLFFIYPGIYRPATPVTEAFGWLSACTLIAVWTLRSIAIQSELRSSLARGASVVAALVVCIHLGMNILAVRSPRFSDVMIVIPWVVPLYLVPLDLLRRFAKDSDLFFFGRQSHAWLARSLCAMAALVVVGATWTRSDRNARDFVTTHASQIDRAAAAVGLQPAILAATIYAAYTETPVWEPVLGDVLTSAWLVDAQSHFMLSKSLDLSMGPAQIKPSTAQTALLLVGASRTGGRWPGLQHSKEFRDGWFPQKRLDLPCNEALAVPMPIDARSTKADVVKALTDDSAAIEMSAAILALYALEWEFSDPSWSIRDRPEILASLYQIGFERSRPKANPASNDFGDLARSAHDAEWMTTLFPSRDVKRPRLDGDCSLAMRAEL